MGIDVGCRIINTLGKIKEITDYNTAYAVTDAKCLYYEYTGALWV